MNSAENTCNVAHPCKGRRDIPLIRVTLTEDTLSQGISILVSTVRPDWKPGEVKTKVIITSCTSHVSIA